MLLSLSKFLKKPQSLAARPAALLVFALIFAAAPVQKASAGGFLNYLQALRLAPERSCRAAFLDFAVNQMVYAKGRKLDRLFTSLERQFEKDGEMSEKSREIFEKIVKVFFKIPPSSYQGMKVLEAALYYLEQNKHYLDNRRGRDFLQFLLIYRWAGDSSFNMYEPYGNDYLMKRAIEIRAGLSADKDLVYFLKLAAASSAFKPSVRELVARTLPALNIDKHQDEVILFLEQLIRDADPDVRVAAFQQLDLIKNSDIRLEMIEKGFKDESEEVQRINVLSSLHYISSLERRVSIIRQYFSSGDQRLIDAALLSLKLIKEDQNSLIDIAREALKRPPYSTPAGGLMAVKYIQDPKVRLNFLNYTLDNFSHPALKKLTIELAVYIENQKDLFSFLEKALGDKNPQVRRKVMSSVKHIEDSALRSQLYFSALEDSKEFVREDALSAASKDKDSEIRLQAINHIPSLESLSLKFKLYERLLEDENPQVRAKAAATKRERF